MCQAMSEPGICKATLARLPGRHMPQVDQLYDLSHALRSEHVGAAACAWADFMQEVTQLTVSATRGTPCFKRRVDWLPACYLLRFCPAQNHKLLAT